VCGFQPGNISFKIPSGGCFQIAVPAFGYGDLPGSPYDDQSSTGFLRWVGSHTGLYRGVYFDVLSCILYGGAVCI
jgi:hypothetical protein